MPAKTKTKGKALDRGEVNAQLEQARTGLDHVRDRIAAGEDVTATELAEAEHHVQLLELRLAAVDDHERRRAEDARLSRIDEIRTSLADGHLAGQTAELLDLAGQAESILVRLHEAATAHNAELQTALVNLRDLEPLPDDIEFSGRRGGMGLPRSVVIDGNRIVHIADLPTSIVVDTARRALADRGDRTGADAISRPAGRAGTTEPVWVTDRLADQAARTPAS